MNQFYTQTDHFVLLPALMLAMFGCAVLLFDFWVFRSREVRKYLPLFGLAGLGFAGWALLRQGWWLTEHNAGEIVGFHASLVVDRFALVFNWLVLAVSALVIAVSYRWTRMNEEREDDHLGEFTGLVLLAQSGMYFLATGIDLITLFVGLELMAVSFYVLVGFNRNERRSNEAAMKYLLLGAFSSGFLAYGMSLMYGISGSTKLRDITAAIADRGVGDSLVLMAVATTAVGLLFKVSAFPFHMWAPDAYEGAPTPVTAFLSVASKAASFAFLMRVFTGPFESLRPLWAPMIAAVAVLSLVAGNFAAITQSNVKRMLAYSSISHAGYILLGLVAGNQRGLTGMVVYLVVYAFMTAGAFLIAASLERQRERTETLVTGTAATFAYAGAGTGGGTGVLEEVGVRTETRVESIPAEDVDDFDGLMGRNPAYALWMLLFMLSLAGIPPTAGFIGKYFIFLALIETGHYALAVIGVLFAAVSLYYYARIVKSMFMSDPSRENPVRSQTSLGFKTAIAAAGALTIGIGVYPEPIIRLTQLFGAK